MNYYRFLWLLLPAFSLALPALAQPVPSWNELVPEDKTFAVQIPGVPKKQTKELKTTQGTLHVVTWVLEPVKSRAGYFLSYSEQTNGGNKGKPEQQLDKARDGALASTKGKLQSEKKLTLQNNPGRELLIELKDNQQLRTRLFVVKDRLYQLFVIGTLDQTGSKDANKFFESFELKLP